jgi:hypothetical protein
MSSGRGLEFDGCHGCRRKNEAFLTDYACKGLTGSVLQQSRDVNTCKTIPPQEATGFDVAISRGMHKMSEWGYQ